jgi:hypothetical protein
MFVETIKRLFGHGFDSHQLHNANYKRVNPPPNSAVKLGKASCFCNVTEFFLKGADWF